MRVIPTKIHGIIDLVVALALIFAPFIFNFVALGGAAVIIPVVFGIVLAVYSLLTQYEVGILRVISVPYHMMIDVILAAALALSPFLFGFADQAMNAWLPHIVVGLGLIIVTLISQTETETADHRWHRHNRTPRHPRAAL